MHRNLLVAAILAAAVSGCVSAPAQVSAAPTAVIAPAAAVVAADDNLNSVLWMQTSMEARAASTQTYRAATRLLDRALADRNWDALDPAERAATARGLPPAVIVDIDETVLDNSPYQARLVADGAEFEEARWDDWVREGKAQLIPGALEFAKAASARGVTVIYISNRLATLKDSTLANLRKVGLPVKDDSVVLGAGTVVPGCEQRGSDKTCRRQLVSRSYRVLMQFGDQLGDFMQIRTNTREGREAVYASHSEWFGERWWVLSNPSYGSWEPALFKNNYRAPRDSRRADKRGALRLDR